MTLYTIRPLVWRMTSADPETWQAETVIGWFCTNGTHWWCEPPGDRRTERCVSINDGRVAAESHYRERLLPALVEVPPENLGTYRCGCPVQRGDLVKAFCDAHYETIAPEPEHARTPGEQP